MACFIAPTATVALVTVIKKRVPKRYHIDWLLLMLWGGVIMLIIDHIVSGEVVFYFPFFTRSLDEILPEIISVGIPMTCATFFVWGCMVLMANVRNIQAKRFAEAMGEKMI